MISLPERVFGNGMEGGVIGWNQVKIHDYTKVKTQY